ncbi:hypothetical protein [Maribacter cobaltidurans]|uniref:hypothetical protein n=1 Tax=Maribacter cobaltidurans TaxID=1178778 RepID=UPI00131598E2|nr:hypothetical protein [Maribacter cobaltidurans]
MKPFQKPSQQSESTNLFFQRPVNRSAQDLVPKDNCFLFGIQHTWNTFKRQHTYSFK